DGVDLRLIEPINLRPRRILTDDVRSIDVKSVCPFDHLDYAGYFRVYPVSHRPERHCMSVDLFSRNWQLQYRRSVAHNSCANLAFVALAAQTLPNSFGAHPICGRSPRGEAANHFVESLEPPCTCQAF